MPSYGFQFKVIRKMDRIRGNDIVCHIFLWNIILRSQNKTRDNMFVSDQIIIIGYQMQAAFELCGYDFGICDNKNLI